MRGQMVLWIVLYLCKNAYDLYNDVANLDIDNTDEEYKVELKIDNEIINKIKNELPKEFIAVQMIATGPLRMMTSVKWISILKQLEAITDLPFVFIDSASRHDLFEKLINENNLDRQKYINKCNISTDINHAVNIISLATATISIDSSFTHIAPAVGVPALGIFGPFLGELRMKYYKNVEWVDATNCECKKYPCFYHGQEALQCPYAPKGKPTICLDEIDESEIVEKFQKLLKGVQSNEQ